MSRGLLDTSCFIALETERPMRGELFPDQLTVSVITIGELRAGVLGAGDLITRNRRLATLTRALALDPVPVDDTVAAAWGHLRIVLRDLGLRMGGNDSWIAATAIALGISVVTQDGGYPEVPGLKIVRV